VAEAARESLAVAGLGLYLLFLFAVWRGGMEVGALETRLAAVK